MSGIIYPGCCCNVCTQCDSAEPGAVVTISGTTDPWCLSAQGNYIFSSYSLIGGSWCNWTAYHETLSDWRIILETRYGMWTVAIIYEPGTPYYLVWYKQPVTEIVCNGGVLEASFTLPGGGPCLGSTASVTLT